jgi:RNA polymerase sigma factor (sigma-70 family)
MPGPFTNIQLRLGPYVMSTAQASIDTEDLVVLVRRAARAEAAAQDELVRRFQDMAVGYACAVLGDRHLAEDVSQDAFVAALEGLSSLREPAAFPAWFRRVLHKHCDRLTRSTTPDLVSLEMIEEPRAQHADPAQELERRERSQIVQRAIGALSKEERSVVHLFYTGGHTHRQIAAFLEMPPDTVNNRLRSARKRLKEGLWEMVESTMNDSAPSRDDTLVNLVGLRTAIEAGDSKRVQRIVDARPDLVRGNHESRTPLHQAAVAGQATIIRILLEAGADPTFDHYTHARPEDFARQLNHKAAVVVFESFHAERLQRSPYGEALGKAITDGDHLGLQQQLEQAGNLDDTDADGRSALHHAAVAGRTDLVRDLVKRGANVDLANPLMERPLVQVLFRMPDPNLEMVRLLLELGAENDLLAACCVGDLETVRAIVATDGYPGPLSPQVPPPVFFYRAPADPLVGAARNGHSDIVAWLLARASDDRDPLRLYGQVAMGHSLTAAATGGHVEVVQMLLDAGQHPEAPEDRSTSEDEVITKRGEPLYQAAGRGHLEVCRLLLERGAPAAIDLPATGTALVAAYTGEHTEVATLLESHGERLDCGDLARFRPDGYLERIRQLLAAQHAAGTEVTIGPGLREGRGEVVALSLSYKPRVEDPFNTLFYACLFPNSGGFGDKVEVVRMLLDYGLDPDTRCPPHRSWGKNVTMLHELSTRYCRPYDRRTEIAGLLLDRGADIEARDDERKSTPLGWAAGEGDREMVEFLLGRGASVAKGEAWTTPLAWARQKGHDDIATLLVEVGARE